MVNNIFKENTLNAIVFKLQLIYSTVKIAIAHLHNELQVYNFTVIADPKVGEKQI